MARTRDREERAGLTIDSFGFCVDEIRKIRDDVDNAPLRSGDFLLAVRNEWGTERFRGMLEIAGLSYTLARQRLWVAAKVPPESPLRGSGLSYTHLRALAVLGPGEMQEWARHTIEEGWTVSQLCQEIRAAGVGVTRRHVPGEECAQCYETIPADSQKASAKIIRWSRGRKAGGFCGAACASLYFSLHP